MTNLGIKVPLSPRLRQIAKTKYFHKTWAGTFTSVPEFYFQPTCVQDIVEIIQNATSLKKTVTVIGSAHSPSDLTMTKDWLVNLDLYNNILSETSHESGCYTDIEVEAGVRIFELNKILDKKGLSLQNLGSISDQSIAGLLSTGTHGSSAFHAAVSSTVVNMTIINSKGEILKCSETENVELFRSALVSLGKIGIIVKVTLRVVPSFNLKSIQQVLTFDEMIANWEDIWTSSEFIRIWWYPYTDKCVCWRASKTDEKELLKGGKSKTDETNGWSNIGSFCYEFLLYLSTAWFPRLTPFVEKFMFNNQFGHLEKFQLEGAKPDKRKNDYTISKSYQGFSLDCLFSQFVDEWAAPMTNGPVILKLLKKSFLDAASKGDFYTHSPVEVRVSNNTLRPRTEKPEEFLVHRRPIDIGGIRGNNVRPYLEASPNLPEFESHDYLESSGLSSDNSLISELADPLLKSKNSLDNLTATHNKYPALDQPITNITNSQLTLYLNIVMYRPFKYNSPIGKCFKMFEDVLIAGEGKPHWAKNFIGSRNFVPTKLLKEEYKDGEMIGFAEMVKKWYGEGLAQYKMVRETQDEHGIFIGGTDWALKNGIIDVE